MFSIDINYSYYNANSSKSMSVPMKLWISLMHITEDGKYNKIK